MASMPSKVSSPFIRSFEILDPYYCLVRTPGRFDSNSNNNNNLDGIDAIMFTMNNSYD